jgi:hypothetical protein
MASFRGCIENPEAFTVPPVGIEPTIIGLKGRAFTIVGKGVL